MPKEGKIIIKGILLGLIFLGIYGFLALKYFPRYPETFTAIERIILALQCFIFPGFMLLVGIITVGLKRTNKRAGDPTKTNKYSHGMQVALRYLSNTHEQIVIYIIYTFGLAILLPTGYLHLVPIGSLLFVLGRITFWVGYWLTPIIVRQDLRSIFCPQLLPCCIVCIT